MIKDWFHKEILDFDLNVLQDFILPKLSQTKWENTHYEQAPGTQWCLFKLPPYIVQKLEEAIRLPIYKDFYVWNYYNIKTLLIHKDNNLPGEARNIAGSIPLLGNFEVQVYSDDNLKTPIDTCIYGPGDILFLNNTKYFHGGNVLSDTRLSLHFYLDFYNLKNKNLSDLLTEYRGC